MTTPAESLERSLPLIRWREPIRVEINGQAYYCCRVCIAFWGLKGSDLGRVGFKTPDEALGHIATHYDDDECC